MAHNINSMAYHDKVPWHGLGTRLDHRGTAREMIKAAGLDWWVERVSVPGSSQNRCQLVRKGRARLREPDLLLGMVTKRYEVLQNEDAFAFFDPIVGPDAAVFETAGALRDGERAWVLAKLPGEIRVTDDDIVNKYLLLSNSHDGRHSVAARFTPIRVVCQNTLTMALTMGPTVRVAHTQSLHERLRQAEKLLGIIGLRFGELEATFREMLRVDMNRARLTEYLEAIFRDSADPDDEKAWERVLTDRAWAAHFFEHGRGNIAPGVVSTLWAAYNGVTEYVDHRATLVTAEPSLNSLWFGDGYLKKARAYKVARARLADWLN